MFYRAGNNFLYSRPKARRKRIDKETGGPAMLEQQQILKQTISLSQRQSLEVLAMNNLDLQEFIGQEQLENPLLEVEFPSPGEDSLVDLAQWLQPGLPRVENGVYRDEDQKGVREPASGRERTYREDLKEQLYSLNIGAGRRELAERVVELIDSRGFLPYTDLELCQLLRCSPGACQAALGVIRSLEPFGVGSRDLGEFLTRQLADKGLLSPALTEICSSFLPVLAEGNYREISAALGLELPVVRQCARLIAALRPSPLEGAADGSSAEYILPDIVVRQGEKGLTASVVDRWDGRVGISGYYQSYLQAAQSPEVRDYLREKIRRARWVMAAMEQRQKTMNALAQAILKFQREFFLGGELAAVTLRQAAQEMGVHESTVSRGVSGKYLQCSRGTFPVRYFFSAGVRAQGPGEASVGRESVKERILQLIREEDPEHPLSDEAIRKRLEADGLTISRRTVTKYRTESGIRSATDRTGVRRRTLPGPDGP